jgi:tripartite-type tricarboxylate transporter receptor subunit TctC
MEKSNPLRRPFSWRLAVSLTALSLPLAACGDSDSKSPAAAEGAKCEMPEEIRLVVPASPGGGFDAWGRLMAPVMADKLGGVEIVVENIAGGGTLRGVNTVYSGPPDGSGMVVFSAQDIALAQTLGHTEDDFELADMAFLGGFAEDPQVFLVAADSHINTIEDLADEKEPVLHSSEEISPIEVLTYDAFGVDAEYILQDGKSEVILSIMRGDADVTVGSLSSVLEYLESGDMKPILYIGPEPTSDLPGYEHVEDAPTPASSGHEGFGDDLVQRRVMAAAPGTPECVVDGLSEAMAETLKDPEFLTQAEEAALTVVAVDGEAAKAVAEKALKAMSDNIDVLKAGIPE